LKPAIEVVNEYTAKDTAYKSAASTITINRFGPSGSLKNANIALEHTIAVIARIISAALFDSIYILIIYGLGVINDVRTFLKESNEEDVQSIVTNIRLLKEQFEGKKLRKTA
jgi:hypothetical protein